MSYTDDILIPLAVTNNPRIAMPSQGGLGVYPTSVSNILLRPWIQDNIDNNLIVLRGSVFNVSTISTNTSIASISGNDVYLVNANSGVIEVTLSNPAILTGKMLTIKKIDSSINVVSVITEGSVKIDGQDNIDITDQYSSLSIVTDGINYFII